VHPTQLVAHCGDFDLPYGARIDLYRGPEDASMFGKTRREKGLRERNAREAQARFERNERVGKTIYAGIADLKKMPRENLPDAVFLLFMEAKQRSELIRRSIEDRTRYDAN
jgi:hypothetical protein